MQPLSKLQYALLERIFRNPGVHGYVLLGDSTAAVSSVYEALRKLGARGLVVQREVTVENAPMRHCYTITRTGRKLLLRGDEALEEKLSLLRERYKRLLIQKT